MSETRITGKSLAKIFHEILERDDWGDISPWWIKAVAEGLDDEDDDFRHHVDVEKLFNEVSNKINLLK